jgi:uncharacterized membrane protein
MEAAAESPALHVRHASHYLLAKDRARQLLYDIVCQYGVQGAKEALRTDEGMASAE